MAAPGQSSLYRVVADPQQGGHALARGHQVGVGDAQPGFEEVYKQKEPECTVEVTFRLYLCSSDYAVQVVRVVKKENENG